MMERKHWIDNLRWATVLLVLFYHVIYFYNNKGVFGGIGGFGDYPECRQYQDIVMYILYPFFMPLLFILAGIGSRYALQKGQGVVQGTHPQTVGAGHDRAFRVPMDGRLFQHRCGRPARRVRRYARNSKIYDDGH